MSSPSSSSWLSIGTAFAAACAASAARAEEFSWQLSGVTSRVESGDFRRDSWAVDGTYYVNPLDDSDGPNELASFLHPTTRVSAGASQVDSDIADDPTDFTLNGAYVLPGKKWYVGANYEKTDVGDLPTSVTRSDRKGYGVAAGRYLGASTTLELGLGRSESNYDFLVCAGIPCTVPTVPYATESTTDSVSLDVFHVRRFRSLTYSLQGGVSESDGHIDISSPVSSAPVLQGSIPTLRVYSVAGELFPTNRLGVRVGYSKPDREGVVDNDVYDVGTTWFFKQRIAVQFALSRTTIENGPPGVDHSDGASLRFIGRL